MRKISSSSILSNCRTIIPIGVMHGLACWSLRFLQKLQKKGSYYFGPQVFNNLPSSKKETESPIIFKTMIKDFF